MELSENSQGLSSVFCFSFSGYVVGRLFTSIFELAVDTTLQCFLCCEAPRGT